MQCGAMLIRLQCWIQGLQLPTYGCTDSSHHYDEKSTLVPVATIERISRLLHNPLTLLTPCLRPNRAWPEGLNNLTTGKQKSLLFKSRIDPGILPLLFFPVKSIVKCFLETKTSLAGIRRGLQGGGCRLPKANTRGPRARPWDAFIIRS